MNSMKKIVTISGGTGGYNLLSGIKKIKNISISAIVCMTDNGGSTGILRDELGVLPPGDVRQCLTALSEETEVVRKLMSYRFDTGKLEGFSFGSILLATLEKITGDFNKGILTASRILKINGEVIPVLDKQATLVANLSDNQKIEGEFKIYDYEIENNPIKSVHIKELVKINPNAKEVLVNADYIIIGPGDHFCSILPNLLVDGFKSAIQNSSAKIIYIANLTNRKGHTLNWTLSNYVSEIEKYIGRNINFIVFNNQKFISEQLSKYLEKEGEGVEVRNDMAQDKRIFTSKLLTTNLANKQKGDPNKSYIRHDYDKLRRVIQKILNYDKNSN